MQPVTKAILIRHTIRIFSMLPLAAMQAIGVIIGYVNLVTDSRSARVTRRNIDVCFPDKTAAEKKQLVRASLIETGKTVAESGLAWGSSNARVMTTIQSIEGEQLLTCPIRENQGLIVLLPHLGNWELFNNVLIQYSPFTALYRPPRIAALNEYMMEVRQRTGATLVPISRHGISVLMQTLRDGGATIILPDQEPPLESGVFTPFFGIPALTMTLAHRLANKTGARVVIACVERLPAAAGFRVKIKDAQAAGGDDQSAALAAMNKLIEECVAEIPEQYQWEYKRFKHRPNSDEDIYCGI